MSEDLASINGGWIELSVCESGEERAEKVWVRVLFQIVGFKVSICVSHTFQ